MRKHFGRGAATIVLREPPVRYLPDGVAPEEGFLYKGQHRSVAQPG